MNLAEQYTRRRKHVGFTLVELMASLVASTALLAGISSTLFIALRANNSASSPTATMLRAAGALVDMTTELQSAQGVTEAGAQALTAVVPDREGDGNLAAETIRYAWSGVAGAPLTRAYNGSATVNVIDSVQSLTFEYFPLAAAPEYVTVRIQTTASTRTVIETSITFLNL